MSIISFTGLILIGLLLVLAGIAVIVIIVFAALRRSNSADKPQEVPVPADTAQAHEAAESAPKCSLGEIIKQHRIRCGMTQEYVAETLNVSRQAVSKWETDSSDPSTSNLLALAKLFGISAAELLENIE